MLWNGSQYFGPGAETLQWPGIHAGQDARPSLQDACRGPGYSKHQSDANDMSNIFSICQILSQCMSNDSTWFGLSECLNLAKRRMWYEHLVLLAPVFICFHLINPCLQVDLTSNLLGHSRQQLVAVKWALLHGKMNFMSFFRASFQTCKTKFDTSCRPSDSDLENSYNILRCSSIQVGHPERKNGSCTKRMTSAKDLRKNSANHWDKPGSLQMPLQPYDSIIIPKWRPWSTFALPVSRSEKSSSNLRSTLFALTALTVSKLTVF